MRPFSSAVLLLLCTALPTWAQGRLGIDFTPGLVPIVPGIYAYEGPLELEGEEEVVRTNSLVIVTSEGVVVVDGQDTLEDGRALISAIGSVTDQPIRYLINASPHQDHINSNELFDGATIVAHEGAFQAIAEIRERAVSENAEVVPTLPHQTYRDRMTIVLGGRRIELHYFGRGHTRGDTVVYIPDAGVVFLSELYFNGVFASVSEGFIREHIKTLSLAMELPAEWWIPGHGYVTGQSQEQLSGGLESYLANLKAIEAAVSLRIDREEPLELVLANIGEDLGRFASLPFFDYLKNSAITGTYRALLKDRR
jgi:cyclase